MYGKLSSDTCVSAFCRTAFVFLCIELRSSGFIPRFPEYCVRGNCPELLISEILLHARYFFGSLPQDDSINLGEGVKKEDRGSHQKAAASSGAG
jgi:hypothetical protein